MKNVKKVIGTIIWLNVFLGFIVIFNFFGRNINQQNILISNAMKKKTHTAVELYAEEEKVWRDGGVEAYDGEATCNQILAWIMDSDESSYVLNINNNRISEQVIQDYKYGKNTILENYLEQNKIYNRYFVINVDTKKINEVKFIRQQEG